MSQPGLDERYERTPAVVTREIVGERILVPIRHNVGDLESIYTLNETASHVWSLLDGQTSVREIRDRIVDEFEVGAEEAERDLLELLAQMEAIGVIERT
jgi:hypothetical protein